MKKIHYKIIRVALFDFIKPVKPDFIPVGTFEMTKFSERYKHLYVYHFIQTSKQTKLK